MAEVRRPVTWEDLGFVLDLRTGRWVDPALQASEGAEDTPDEALSEDELALLTALAEYSQSVRAMVWDPGKHPRGPGGRFRSNVDVIKGRLEAHFAGKGGDPFEGYSRDSLRRVARQRGIDLTRGESRESIAAKLLASLHGEQGKPTAKPAAAKPATGAAALKAAPIQLGPDERLVRGARLVPKRGVDALAFYRGDGFYHINDGLREDTYLGSPEGGSIASIDEVMAASKLARAVVVHRGVKSLAMFGAGNRQRSDLTGLEFVERAYSSTTADRAVADEFYGEDVRGEGAILNIRVPAGTGAVQLSALGPKPRPGNTRPYEEEAELLLDRGLTYRIVGDRIVNGRRELDAEVVPA